MRGPGMGLSVKCNPAARRSGTGTPTPTPVNTRFDSTSTRFDSTAYSFDRNT